MEEHDHLATPSEACREYAYNFGSDHPDQEWILTPWDTWEKNPAFTGTPSGRHPEDDRDFDPVLAVDIVRDIRDQADMAPLGFDDQDAPF